MQQTSGSFNEIITLAYFLPQFHEIEENNKWWGEGFTEWTNLRQARRFRKNQEIRRPVGPFGEYNLLNPAVLAWHQHTAEQYGIDGFFVWDYWFGEGKKLLSRPIELVLREQIPFRYCFNWANHSWYNKTAGLLLMEQRYLGEKDYLEYFNWLLPHFRNENYIKIDGKPVFGVFRPMDIPDLSTFIRVFNESAVQNGFGGIFWIAENTLPSAPEAIHFDRVIESGAFFSIKNRFRSSPIEFLRYQLISRYSMNDIGPSVFKYPTLVLGQPTNLNSHRKTIPAVLAGWDTTPRHGRRGMLLKGFTRETFQQHVRETFAVLEKRTQSPEVVIIKSWNEWAEGNLLEPDSVFGNDLLEIFHQELEAHRRRTRQ